MPLRRTPPPSMLNGVNQSGNAAPGNLNQADMAEISSDCQMCTEPNNDAMVMCDDCDLWHHFTCAGVTADIAATNVPWSCVKCVAKKYRANSKSSKASKSSSRRRLIQLELDNLNEAREMEQKRLEELAKAKAETDKQYLDKKLQLMREQEELSSEDDKESVDDHNKQSRTNQWVQSTSELGTHDIHDVNLALVQKRSTTGPLCTFRTQAAVHHSATNAIATHQLASKTMMLRQSTYEDENAISSFEPPAAGVHLSTNKAPSANQRTSQVANILQLPFTAGYVDRSSARYTNREIASDIRRDAHVDNQPILESLPARQPTIRDDRFSTIGQRSNVEEPFRVERNLTRNQIAARQALPKDLPPFTGKPEEWPIFISAFERSTNLCGFTFDENLVRLQKCLKGKAFEAVSSRLMLPSAVPRIIETLRQLFGRPEYIINILLQKLRNESVPRMDRLETIISYSLSVENLCATMEASGLVNHLCNPMLLQELVDKLPSALKLSWAIHQQTLLSLQPPSIVTISSFSQWISGVAGAASSVTMPTDTRHKEKAFVHAHSDVQESSNRSTEKGKCYVCSNSHQIADCTEFKSLNLSAKWKIVKDKNLCRQCLIRHGRSKCKSTRLCGKDNCKFKHHPLLHKDTTSTTTASEQSTSSVAVAPTTSSVESNCHTHQQSKQSILYRVVPVMLHSRSKSISTFAFLDEGSSLTLLEEETAAELGLAGPTESLCLRWTSDTVRVERESRRVSLQISGNDRSSPRYMLSNVRTVKNLSLPVQTVSAEKLREEFPYLSKLPLPEYTDARPRILIGIDHGKLGLPLEIKEGSWTEPIATRTRLGWAVHGCVNHTHIQPSPIAHHHFHACDCQSDGNLHKLVQDFFAIDTAGVKVQITIESDEDVRAKKIMYSTTVRVEDRFQTGLLWKYEKIDLPDSLPMAKRRLICLEKKMATDEKLANNLKSQIREYVAKGYARRLSPREVEAPHPRTWYLPIFVVTNPNKPEKMRIVWDAAAKVNGTSLNSVLLKGPDQLASLLSVLFGFREHRIAICGDIREMFHQVRVRPEDQNSQRFLWRDDHQSEPSIYVMQVMTFGATCSPSSAQYVKNKNALEFVEKYPRAALAITNRHYVDDLLDSVNTEDEAIKLAKEVRFIHSKAGFEIRNWVSNSPKVLKALGESKDHIKKDLNICNEIGTEKVLGMWWCTASDSFSFKVNYSKVDAAILTGQRRATKREILRTLMSIFDPLGFLSFFMVYVKILLQQIWRSKTDWDQEITSECEEKWQVWAKLLPLVEKVFVPRCYSLKIPIETRTSTQLHIFVDASENAYAAVAFLRVESQDQIECGFVASKTKVAPLTPMTIPRLELQAALLGARLAKTICDAHSFKIDKRVFWSDSRSVLSWLASDQRRYRQFVAFRIVEILEITEIYEWRWIPTRMNVADEATKWQKTPEFSKDSRWFCGPEFLLRCEDDWPKIPSDLPKETDEEVRANFHHIALQQPHTADPARFHSWQHLLNVQARAQRYSRVLFAKKRKFEIAFGPFEPLQSVELDLAQKQLYRRAQFDCFADEIATLNETSTSKVIDKSSALYTWSPYLDIDGLLRIRGRIDAANIHEDAKRPIILPRDHEVTKLIVSHFHVKFHHQNHETTINELRRRYAIPRIRQVLKSVRSKCQKCKNDRAVPHPPEMGALPAARLAAYSAPFTFVGLDFFGPMTVVVGRRTEKRWGVIFTCLTIRAIHLEIAHSLSTDSCIMCVRNFIARRGVPKEFYCDNGTNFHGADNELKKAFDEISLDDVLSRFTTAETRWIFNPPASPHMGGSWERLVGSVKRVLNKILPDRHPNDEVLRTLLVEAEDIVNSRPLTFVSVEKEDETALTPNHFLKGSSSGSKPPGEFNDRDLILRKNWRKSQYLANQFWKRWVAEYLPTLTRRTKWFAPVKPIEVDDIVVVVDDTLPRNSWPLGRVVSVKPGKDGAVRRVTVRTQHGLYERPAVKIAVLDVK